MGDGPGRYPQITLRPPGWDVGAFALLLAVNAWTGGAISRLEVSGNALHLTEIALALIGLLALHRLGLERSVQVLRRAAPLWLGLFALAGLVGGVRGLIDAGLSASLYDIELFLFAAAVPIVVLVADTDERRRWLFGAVVVVCAVGTVLFAGAEVIARATDDSSLLADQEGEIGAGAFYACFTAVWALGRIIRSEHPLKPVIAIACLALALVVVSDKRTAWVAIVAAVILLVLLARGRRLVLVGGIGLLALTVPVAYLVGAETEVPAAGSSLEMPDSAPGEDSGNGAGDDPEGRSQAERELGGFLGGDDLEGENVEWRIAFWEELLDRLGDEPTEILTGAGFGPTEFDRGSSSYDYRVAGSEDDNNTTGPHNAFVGTLYLTGIVGLVGLVGILATAALRLLATLRRSEADDRSALIAVAAMVAIGVVYMSLTESLRAPDLSLFIWAAVGLILAAPAAPRKPG